MSVITELAECAVAGGRVAIDTEFVSERRYQALLCLAQVAVPDPDAPGGVRTEVLDPIEHELDPAPLARVLADPAIEIVVHAGRQDVGILRRSWNTDVTNVFDTQIAAGFLGFGNQEGYESLVRKALRVKLKGSEGFTRWDRRPLNPQQLESPGRARSRSWWRSRPTSAAQGAPTSGCPASAASPTAAVPWRVSSPSGARRPPARRTGRPAR